MSSEPTQIDYSTPFYFASPLKGFPLELGTGAGIKNLEW